MSGPERLRPAYETARLKLVRLRVEGDHARSRAARQAATISAETICVGRVGIWFFRDHGKKLVCLHQYDRSGGPNPGETLETRTFPGYFQALQETRAIVADDALTHPVTSELAEAYLVPHGITSLMDAPIIREGRVVGVVCHEHTGPQRIWEQREIDFASSVADLLALLFEQADRLELEAALQARTEHRLESEKMEALGRMARAVAHDLNNLLVVVASASTELLEGTKEDRTSYAQHLEAVAKTARGLTGQLLAFGTDASETRDCCNARQVLDGLWPVLQSLSAGRAGLALDVRTPDCDLGIGASHLEQILMNLCTNAFEACAGNHGHVIVRLRDVTLEDEVPLGSLVLEVQDEGTGMRPEVAARVFEPYFTTKATGTETETETGNGNGHGLGLSSVHGIVRRVGGAIRVVSEVGRGSRFFVALPRAVT